MGEFGAGIAPAREYPDHSSSNIDSFLLGAISLLNGSFGPSLRPMARGSRASVEPGQRFMQNNVAWEVSRVTPVGDILHAEIVKVGDATVRKLISVRALIEGFDPQPE